MLVLLRPGRLQAVQRRLRPPGRGRAAGAARRAPRVRRDRPGPRLPARWRRVLRALHARARRASSRCWPRARPRSRESGEGFAIGASYGAVVAPGEAEDATEALQVADRRMYAQKGGRRDVRRTPVARRAPQHAHRARAGARRAPARRGRSWPLAVGRELDMGPEELDEVARAAELHDVGKVAIPDAILNKPGPLDEAEWSFMRRHTIIGERILLSAPALRPVARLVRSSHERWDGGGYPDGLAGEEIPLGARIVAVCDAFDAMTTDRPYRRARSPSGPPWGSWSSCAGSAVRPARGRRVRARAAVLRPERRVATAEPGTDLRGHLLRSGLEPPRGHPQHALTGDGQLRVAQAVLLERAPRAWAARPSSSTTSPASRQRKSTSWPFRSVLTSGRGRPWQAQSSRKRSSSSERVRVLPALVVGEHGRQPAEAGPPRIGSRPGAVEAEVLGLVEGALERSPGRARRRGPRACGRAW